MWFWAIIIFHYFTHLFNHRVSVCDAMAHTSAMFLQGEGPAVTSGVGAATSERRHTRSASESFAYGALQSAGSLEGEVCTFFFAPRNFTDLAWNIRLLICVGLELSTMFAYLIHVRSHTHTHSPFSYFYSFTLFFIHSCIVAWKFTLLSCFLPVSYYSVHLGLIFPAKERQQRALSHQPDVCARGYLHFVA